MEPESIQVGEIARRANLFVRRRLTIILLCFLGVASLGVTYLLVAPPKFTASTKILIGAQSGSPNLSNKDGIEPLINSSQIESEIQIVTSENVSRNVIETLHLDKDPQFLGERDGAVGNLMKIVKPIILPIFFSLEPQKTYADANNDYNLLAALGIIQRNLQVERVGISYVVEISYSSTDRERSARIANAFADAYLDENNKAREHAFSQTSAWLRDRLTGLRAQAEDAEQAVSVFEKENNIDSTTGKALTQEKQEQLREQVTKAQQRTADAKAKLNDSQNIISMLSASGDVTALAGVAFSDPIMTSLRQQYIELSNRERELTSTYGENSTTVRNLRINRQTLKDSMLQELQQINQRASVEYNGALKSQLDLENELIQASKQEQDWSVAQAKL